MDQDLERFWEACGSRPPLRLQIRERDRPDSAEVRGFARPFLLIGRDPRTDLVLDHPEISRRHAYIQVVEGRAFCFDLDSRTAISWSGSPRRSGWLEASRPIQLGHFRLGLPQDEEPQGKDSPSPGPGRRSSDPLWASVPAGADGLQPVLERADAPGGVARWTIDHPLTLVGRSPECGLKLTDLSVSRFHAALLRSGEGVWVVDLLGREGILVNDEPVRWARLDRGDRLQVGRFHLVLRAVPADRRGRRVASSYEAGPIRALGSRSGLRVVSGAEPEPELGAPPAPVARVVSGPAMPASELGPVAPVVTSSPVPYVPTLPAERLGSEILPESIRYAEAMLAPILNQLALMQQQMFDQYHQSMMAMVQMFGKLHQDQQDLVDRELEEIRKLTREVREIQVALAAAPPPTTPRPASPAPPLTDFVAQPAMAPPVAGPGPLPAEPAMKLPPLPEGDYRHAHAALIQRMQNLQQERQSRWQSLLGRLTGGRVDPGL